MQQLLYLIASKQLKDQKMLAFLFIQILNLLGI